MAEGEQTILGRITRERVEQVAAEVASGLVSYRQLDAHGQPSSAGRRIPLAVLMANFVPEAAAY